MLLYSQPGALQIISSLSFRAGGDRHSCRQAFLTATAANAAVAALEHQAGDFQDGGVPNADQGYAAGIAAEEHAGAPARSAVEPLVSRNVNFPNP